MGFEYFFARQKDDRQTWSLYPLHMHVGWVWVQFTTVLEKISFVPQMLCSRASYHMEFQLDEISSVAETTTTEGWELVSWRVHFQSFAKMSASVAETILRSAVISIWGSYSTSHCMVTKCWVVAENWLLHRISFLKIKFLVSSTLSLTIQLRGPLARVVHVVHHGRHNGHVHMHSVICLVKITCITYDLT